MTPGDSLFGSQWHYSLLGTRGSELLVQRLWNEYSGAGVAIGIYDDGVQVNHYDLQSNYSAAREISIAGQRLSGAATQSTSRHGTAVAGLIAASANGSDSVGLAYGASITGVNIFDSLGSIYVNSGNASILGNFYSAVHQATNFSVINNSWGSKPNFTPSQNLTNEGGFAETLEDEYAHISSAGRSGLGTVVVQAAGNDNTNANGDGVNASRFTITVGAIHQDGYAASYSNYGANLLVSSAGGDYSSIRNGLGIVTTDRTDVAGYNLRGATTTASNFTNDFGGTSAATPLVTATVALMLEANPNLGWRDVQAVLALSADHTGSAIGSLVPGYQENSTWFINHAGNWNGGAQHFSEDYGFGRVNAFAAVRMAEVWSLFSPAQTSANEKTVTTGTLSVNRAIADLSTLTEQFTLAANISLEHVDLTLNLNHSYFTDLRIFLVSPQGTEVQLLDGRTGNGGTSDTGLRWTYGIEAFRGENAAGIWTLRIVDAAAADTGTLTSINLTAFGSQTSANDTFHYTDEFLAMNSLDVSRSVLTDTDGGTDWIDAAAITSDLSINLNAGATSTIAGQKFISIAATTTIENAVTGDGNDVLLGNALNNTLYGMRGNDMLNGGLGIDHLFGGAGNDQIVFDSADLGGTINGGAGVDTLLVNNQPLPLGFNLATNEFEFATLNQQSGSGYNQVIGTTTYDNTWAALTSSQLLAAWSYDLV